MVLEERSIRFISIVYSPAKIFRDLRRAEVLETVDSSFQIPDDHVFGEALTLEVADDLICVVCCIEVIDHNTKDGRGIWRKGQ